MTGPGVYILGCANGRYYVGSTQDIERRLSEHQAGRVRSTRSVRPLKLVFFSPCNDVASARRVEYKLKSKKSKKILEQIIAEGVIKFIGS